MELKGMSFHAQTRDHKEGKMQNSSKTAASLDELLAAASDEKVSQIVVRGAIADAPFSPALTKPSRGKARV